MSKYQISSPTISNEALFLTLTIDAKEVRDVLTSDIPVSFLQTDIPKGSNKVHIKLDGAIVELFAKINPQLYWKYIILSKKGKPLLYGEAHKAIYGTLNASLIFYNKLVKSLQDWGFELNPYEWCCANKIIDVKQCAILCHVDDLNISHVDPNAVTAVIADIHKEYNKTDTVTFTRGKVHNWLGIKIDFSAPEKVKIAMNDSIFYILNDAPNDMIGEAATSAGDHIFQVN